MRLALGMTQKQCAAYLRAGESTIRKWESGSSHVPFAEFELLRLIWESVSFKMSHPEWDGWFISEKGELVSPDLGGRQGSFTPERLNWLSWMSNDAAMARNEAKQLKTDLDEAIAENTRLRQMFLSQGVVDELYSLHDRMSGLVKQLATAHVIPLHADKEESTDNMPMVKAA